MSTSPGLPVLTLTLAVLVLSACSKSEEQTSATPAAATTPATPKSYTVTLTPTIKTGQKFTYLADLAQNTKQDTAVTVPGAPAPQNQNEATKTLVHVEGEGEVLAVNSNGTPQKISLTVKALSASANDKPTSGLPAAGAKLVAERNGKDVTITVDGKAVSDEIKGVLADALPVESDKHSDQEMFGPTKPVAAGSTWSVNVAAMVAGMKDDMDGAELSNPAGTMKLENVKGSGDDQVATVSGNFTATIKPPGIPPGINLDTSTASGTITEIIPATTKGAMTQTYSLSVVVAAHGDMQGVQLKMNMAMEQKKSATVTFH